MTPAEQVSRLKPPAITVTGTSDVDAVADEATVSFRLTASGRSSDGALDTIRKRIAELTTLLGGAGVDEDDRGQVVSVSEQREQSGGRWLTKGYQASATVTATIRDIDVLGPLLTTAVQEVGPKVDPPLWRLSTQHPAKTEARHRAATEAKQRAETYADALGLQLGDVLDVYEPDTGRPQVEFAARRMSIAGSHHEAEDEGEPELELRPAAQRVHASVTVRFAIRPQEI